MKKITYHIVLIAIVFCCIFLGTLPDLFPQYMSFPPNLKQYDYALRSLTIPNDYNINYKTLEVGENGYNQIFNLIRSFDTVNIPPLDVTIKKSKEKKGFGTIASVKSGMEWRPITSTKKPLKSIDPFLFICFKGDNETYIPICQLNDLRNLIHEAKIRFWSRLGFFFAFVALLIGEGASLRASIMAWIKSKS